MNRSGMLGTATPSVDVKSALCLCIECDVLPVADEPLSTLALLSLRPKVVAPMVPSLRPREVADGLEPIE